MWDRHADSYRRLLDEPIGWLTTVNGEGIPSTAPIWFLLEDDDSILVYSKDPSVRVRNLRANPRITLHLEGDGRGGAIVVVNGEATIDDDTPPANDHVGFIAKYQGFLDRYGWTSEYFAAEYPRPIRITIASVRGD
jgi:PPOX class probable F420-dependent enzyme